MELQDSAFESSGRIAHGSLENCLRTYVQFCNLLAYQLFDKLLGNLCLQIACGIDICTVR